VDIYFHQLQGRKDHTGSEGHILSKTTGV